jgi:hypothetical protein
LSTADGAGDRRRGKEARTKQIQEKCIDKYITESPPHHPSHMATPPPERQHSTAAGEFIIAVTLPRANSVSGGKA